MFDLREYIDFLGPIGALNNDTHKATERFSMNKHEKALDIIITNHIKSFFNFNSIENKNIVDLMEKLWKYNKKKYMECWKELFVKFHDEINSSEITSFNIYYAGFSIIIDYLFKDTSDTVYNFVKKYLTDDKVLRKEIFLNNNVYLTNLIVDYLEIVIKNKDYTYFCKVLKILSNNKIIDFNEIVDKLIGLPVYDLEINQYNIFEKSFKDNNILLNSNQKIILKENIKTWEEERVETIELKKSMELEKEIKISTESNKLDYVFVVGIQYEGRFERFKKLNFEDKVFLTIDNENQYDNNAVKVLNENKEIIGYISRKKNVEIKEKLNNSISYDARVSSFYNNKQFSIRIIWK